MAKIKLVHDLRRGDTLTLKVESLANGGDGVAKASGLPVFIERSAVGDELAVNLFDVRKDFVRGQIEKIISPSPERVSPPCRHFDQCGGCQWQHIDYQSQLAHKESLVRQSLRHIGGMEGAGHLVETICGASPAGQLHYRNKAQFPVQYVNGKFVAGYYGRGSHDLVNVEACSIQPPAMDKVLDTVRQLLKKYRLHAYEEKTHRGLIRHINLRQSFGSGKQLVTIVINHDPLKFSRLKEDETLSPLLDVARDLVDVHSQIDGVVVNFNSERGNRILGGQSLVLVGVEYIEEELKSERPDQPERLRQGLRLRLSSESFFQVNTGQAVALLEIVSEMARAALSQSQAPLIIDAYAGVGTISLWLAPIASQVVAVEENPSAVADGRANSGLNGMTNVEFVQGRVEDVLGELMAAGRAPHLLVVDPPRKGIAPEVLAAIKEHGPEHLIYVSCNPATLARDLKLLEDRGEKGDSNGYKTKRIKPVDFFPTLIMLRLSSC